MEIFQWHEVRPVGYFINTTNSSSANFSLSTKQILENQNHTLQSYREVLNAN